MNLPYRSKPSRPQKDTGGQQQQQQLIMVKGSSGLLQLLAESSLGKTGTSSIKQIEQHAYSNLQNSPSHGSIRLDHDYIAQQIKKKQQKEEARKTHQALMIVGTDVHNIPVPEIDYNHPLLQGSYDETTEGDRRSIVSYEKQKLHHESSDESDNAADPNHNMTHKLRAQQKNHGRHGGGVRVAKARLRKSILNEMNSSNSELDKTISNFGQTTFNFASDFNRELDPQRQPYQQLNLPSIDMRQAEDTSYMNKTNQRGSPRFSKQASKTTLNIMNVTFNTRPGVKQYIKLVTGRKTKESHSQLPKQGQRAHKHNGYNNFYFSGQKRGTIQRFNLLDNESKTRVQHNLYKEATQKQKLATKQSKAHLELMTMMASSSRVNNDGMKRGAQSKLSKKYAAVNTTYYSPMNATQMTGVQRQPTEPKQRPDVVNQLPITQNIISQQMQNESQSYLLDTADNFVIEGIEEPIERKEDKVKRMEAEIDVICYSIGHTTTLEKQQTLQTGNVNGNASTFTVHNLDDKSDSENSFNQSEEDDGDSHLADTSQMKITTSKLAQGPRATAPSGFANMEQNKFGQLTKKKKMPRQMAMHQTYGGIQPWHEMQKKQKIQQSQDSDGIFSRHKQHNNLHSASEMNSSHFSNFGSPAILDGRILLLDAKEAVMSMNDNESSINQASQKQSSLKRAVIPVTKPTKIKQKIN